MKFKLLSISVVIAVIVAFLLIKDYSISGRVLGGLVFIYLSVIGLASYRFDWNFFLDAIHKGKPGKLVITFDDGPHPQHTPAILDILKQYQVPATFFLIGKNAEAHQDLVRRIHNEKHEIGNHSYSHSNFHGFYSSKQVIDEIGKTNELLHSITKEMVTLYRPPFGVTNPNIAEAVRSTGVKVIGWDIRSLDTTAKTEDELFNRIIGRIANGSILLLHDTQERTVKVLPRVIEYCRNAGVEIIPLKQALA